MKNENGWTREQTIVVLRTYFTVLFNKANNSNPEIINTAKVIGRSVNSVKMKVGNFGSLDPELAKRGIVGLDGTTKLDREIWNEYYNEREKLAFDSSVLIAKFSKKDILETLDINREEILEGKEVSRWVKTRVNQYFFRQSVLALYESTCCITGLQIPQMLVASHIVPWAKDKENRLNQENGLCLNSIHDKAFDIGLLTITPDYKVKLSKAIKDLYAEKTVKRFFTDFENRKITLPERYYPRQSFLEYHNKNIFKK